MYDLHAFCFVVRTWVCAGAQSTRVLHSFRDHSQQCVGHASVSHLYRGGRCHCFPGEECCPFVSTLCFSVELILSSIVNICTHYQCVALCVIIMLTMINLHRVGGGVLHCAAVLWSRWVWTSKATSWSCASRVLAMTSSSGFRSTPHLSLIQRYVH